MSKKVLKKIVKHASKATSSQRVFDDVLTLIDAARTRAFAAVNTAMIDLYWSIGEHISGKIADEGWGKGTVQELAAYIQRRQPNARELSWTHNLLIMSRSKREEERGFYLRVSLRERWGKRELERQLAGALFERTVLSPPKLAPAVRELHPDAATIFRDSYLIDFLHLPIDHSEANLHRGLVEQLKNFLIELGRDFCFVGSHYPIQVGTRDFELDLLFFNRAINCLVAIELKIDEFQPEYLGKLEFYLEALDRDVKKPHEQPSVGVLLCATKNHEVVEYALSRAMSPAVVAEYQTRLPDKKLLQAKLYEFYELAKPALPAAAAAKSSVRHLAKPKKPLKK